MTARRERFVTTKHFLDSARSIDITIEEAVFEIVDNAFDADARNIRIDVEKNKQGFLRMTFSDDGVGIPASHIDKDGIEHEGIPYVLAYGGRIPHPGQPQSSLGAQRCPHGGAGRVSLWHREFSAAAMLSSPHHRLGTPRNSAAVAFLRSGPRS